MQLVGRLQRQHIERLQAMQPNRGILVQPRTEDPAKQKEVPWRGLESVPPGAELWTHSTLLNEVLFDLDAKPWSRVADGTAALHRILNELRVPYYAGPSGGKGTHTSVFLDPKTIHGDKWLLERANALGVDLWTEARLVFAEQVIDTIAGKVQTDAERWAPPLGATGIWDRSKVRWSASRSGSMVRCIGTHGSAGFRKTLVEWSPEDWARTRTLDAPPHAPLDFHVPATGPYRTLHPLAPALNALVIDRIAAAVDTIEAARAKERNEVQVNPLEAIKKAKAVPCIARILNEPAPRGTRHYAFLNLAVRAKALGVPRKGAESLLRQALARCGLDDTDPAWATLAEVYEGRWRMMALRCPSPDVGSWCQPNCCPLSNKMVF